jgi:acetyltransferase-like isoleucine patch superfamily enzyme
MKRYQVVIAAISIVAPFKIRRLLLNYLLGWKIDKAARIGFSIIIADRVIMAPEAKIGHMNFIAGLTLLRLDQTARISKLNILHGVSRSRTGVYPNSKNRRANVFLQRGSSITTAHYLDCSDQIVIGEFSTLAGFRSQIVTHSVDLTNATQGTARVRIGERTFIGTSSVILKGTKVPSFSVFAAGSVITNDIREDCALYGGVPARKIRPLPRSLGYFHRNSPSQ